MGSVSTKEIASFLYPFQLRFPRQIRRMAESESQGTFKAIVVILLYLALLVALLLTANHFRPHP